ncbi:hypothetical protein BpHYR1_025915 [Brachionus plicatilis]|uniref:Uncharacterized protein n=1 Tax=Brachionus plicatilis TaxID=10195 RepID=A0A3M7QAE1_BRAPC|nr:hypothetical protein BpHYR1_025915 [Brachionus plicatilis]
MDAISSLFVYPIELNFESTSISEFVKKSDSLKIISNFFYYFIGSFETIFHADDRIILQLVFFSFSGSVLFVHLDILIGSVGLDDEDDADSIFLKKFAIKPSIFFIFDNCISSKSSFKYLKNHLKSSCYRNLEIYDEKYFLYLKFEKFCLNFTLFPQIKLLQK